MKSIRYAAAVLLALAVAGWSFYVYGGVRTMQEHVGLAARPVLASAAFALVTLAAGAGAAIAARSIARRRLAISMRTLALLASAWLLGCTASEVWILADERSFARELSLRPAASPYSRSRNWPNEGCALVYVPHQGIHATD